MDIAEAMHAVTEEFNAETVRAEQDAAFDSLMAACLNEEYEEIDRALPDYVAEIARAMGIPGGTVLPKYVYQTARMCFRMGMRTQRKLDRPNVPTSLFWRSDQEPV
jgi:hypothetical protein